MCWPDRVARCSYPKVIRQRGLLAARVAAGVQHTTRTLLTSRHDGHSEGRERGRAGMAAVREADRVASADETLRQSKQGVRA